MKTVMAGHTLKRVSGTAENGIFFIPEGTEDLDVRAFEEAKGIEELHLPASMPCLTSRAISQMRGLKRVIFHGKDAEAGDGVFLGCADLLEVRFSEGVRRLGRIAFCGCTDLRFVGPLDGLQEMGEGCFRDCCSLEEIQVPERLSELPEAACINCRSLRYVHLHRNFEKIGAHAFFGCSSLLLGETDLSFVREIGTGAFTGVRTPEKLRLDSLTDLGNWPFDMNHLKSLFCPALRRAGQYSFFGGELEEVVLGRVEAIETRAFSHQKSLRRVSAKRIGRIGDSAFSGCDCLETVACREIGFVGPEAFRDCRRLDVQEVIKRCRSVSSTAFQFCQFKTVCITDRWFPDPDRMQIRTGHVRFLPSASVIPMAVYTGECVQVEFCSCHAQYMISQMAQTDVMYGTSDQGAHMYPLCRSPEDVVYTGFMQLLRLSCPIGKENLDWLIGQSAARHRTEDTALVLQASRERNRPVPGWSISFIWTMGEKQWETRVCAAEIQQSTP